MIPPLFIYGQVQHFLPLHHTTATTTQMKDEIIIRITGKKPVRLVWDDHMAEWVPYLLDEDKRN